MIRKRAIRTCQKEGVAEIRLTLWKRDVIEKIRKAAFWEYKSQEEFSLCYLLVDSVRDLFWGKAFTSVPSVLSTMKGAIRTGVSSSFCTGCVVHQEKCASHESSHVALSAGLGRVSRLWVRWPRDSPVTLCAQPDDHDDDDSFIGTQLFVAPLKKLLLEILDL